MKISKYTKQMNRNAFVWSCFVMTFFSACQQEEHEMSQANEWQMSIVASIKGQKNALDSRYVGDDPSNVVFEETDGIGVFIDDAPALEWTYGESGWSAIGPIRRRTIPSVPFIPMRKPLLPQMSPCLV